jgi:hypothetical protein
MCRTSLITLAFCVFVLGCPGRTVMRSLTAAEMSADVPRIKFVVTRCHLVLPNWSELERQLNSELTSVEIWISRNDDVDNAMGIPFRSDAECAFGVKEHLDQLYCDIVYPSARKVAVVVFVDGRRKPDYCRPITVTCQGSAPWATKPVMTINAKNGSVCWHPLN